MAVWLLLGAACGQAVPEIPSLLKSPGWVGIHVFTHHSTAAKRVHGEGICKRAEEQLVNAQHLCRGTFTSSTSMYFKLLTEASKSKSSMPMLSHSGKL